jgi:Cu/Zn superoxide dismutase
MKISTLLPVAPICIGLALAGCGDGELAEDEVGTEAFETEPEAPPLPESTPLPEATADERTIAFEPGPAGENVTGTLTITSSGVDAPQVTAQFSGLTPGEHAWHIHAAPCGEEGPVVVAFTPTADMEGIAEAVVAGDDGNAMATASIPPDLLPLDQIDSGQYSVHVHEQGGVDHGPTVACANLSGTQPSL